MSGELEAMGNSMVLGQVPECWSAVSYPSLKPLGSWMSDFLSRIDFLQTWLEKGEAPAVYWISGFFFTQAFITGTLQNFARKYKLPIDQVDFDMQVMTSAESSAMKGTISFVTTIHLLFIYVQLDTLIHSDIQIHSDIFRYIQIYSDIQTYSMTTILLSNKPEQTLTYPLLDPAPDGAYVQGLYLEGAQWLDAPDMTLGESHHRVLQTPMPIIWLLPKPSQDIEPVKDDSHPQGTAHVYLCPVYKTSKRQGTLSTTGHSTNFVMMIRLPMSHEHDQKHWTRRGVAMLTQLDG